MKRSVFIVAFLTAGIFGAQAQQNLSRQNEYARRLDRTLMSNGLSAEVFVSPPAALTIYAYLSKSTVYQLSTTARVLETARAAGVTKVIFFDKGADGKWTFDVSSGIPACDLQKRICF